jgi:hypothetical protein
MILALEKLYEGLAALLGGPFFGHQGSGVLGQALAADHASSLPSPGFPWSIREESDRQPESGTDQYRSNAQAGRFLIVQQVLGMPILDMAPFF